MSTGSKVFFAAAVVCLGVSSSALGVALTHAGPKGSTGRQGVQGPVGKTGPAGTSGKSANPSQDGVCISYFTDNTGAQSFTWVSDVEAPVWQNGVRSCMTGSFVPVSPPSNG